MASPAPKVILITGASSGIGKACAEHLASRGHRVYGTSRRMTEPSRAFTMIPMDVTDERSTREGVQRVMGEAGRLDVLVNNAGMGFAGPVEETTLEEARQQFETNFFGVLRVCRESLPILRRQGSGLIVNVSSIGGRIGLPFEGLYSASKFALEGLSEALRLELRPFGIRVVLLEPGDIKTPFGAHRVLTRESRQNSSYQSPMDSVLALLRRDEDNAPAPERVARVLGRIVRMKSPALRYTVGPFLQRIAVGMKGIVPGGLFERIIRSAYKL